MGVQMAKPSILFLTSHKSIDVTSNGDSPRTHELFDVANGTQIDKHYDLVYTQMYGQEVVFSKLERYHHPYVVHVGGDIFTERMELGRISTLGRIKKIMRNARAVICVSKFLAKMLRSHLGSDNVIHLPHGMWGLDHTRFGVRTDQFERKTDYAIYGRPNVAMNISLTVERKWKGLPIFLDAVKDVVRDYNIELHCYGKLKKNVDVASLFTRLYGVQFDGYVEDWPSVLRQSDVFVHPSCWDGFPRAIADACCAGVPALVFDEAGCPEVSENAVIVGSDDKRVIASKFENLISSIKHRSDVGNAMYKEAIEKTEKYRGEYAELLFSLVNP